MKSIVFLAAAIMGIAATPAAAQSDAQIRQKIIKASIDSYSGACPCPYNTKRNGARCGGTSAYSRPGGESPKCYASDVSKAEVVAYKGR